MSEFLWSGRTYAQMSLERTIRDESVANREAIANFQAEALQRIDASAALHEEFVQEFETQRQMLTDAFDGGISELAEAQRRGFEDVVVAIDYTSKALGTGLAEIQWAVERHAHTTRQIYELLLESRANESRQVFRQGVECYQVGDYDDARVCLGEALEIDRTNHLACQYLGMLSIIQKHHDEAVNWFRRASRYSKTDYHRGLAYLHLARTFVEVGDFDRARIEAESAYMQDPTNPRFCYELARSEARVGRIDEAMRSLDRTIHLDQSFWVSPLVDHAFGETRREVIDVLRRLKDERRAEAARALDQLVTAVQETTRIGKLQRVLAEVGSMDDAASAILEDNYFRLPAVSKKVIGIADRINPPPN